MIVNAALQPVKNDTVYWLTSDTEELYQQNVSNPERKKLLEEWGWLNTTIEYTFNSDGFRSIEFTAEQPAIAVFGCSFTQGIGLHYEQIWHQHLSRRLNRSVYNFGIGGCGLDTCYRLAEHYLPRLNVDTVILLAPHEYRIEFWSDQDSFPWFLNINSTPAHHEFFRMWCRDPRNAENYAIKNLQSFAYICQTLGMDFYYYPLEKFSVLNRERTFARDLMHFSERPHRGFAEIVYNDIDFKRVYYPRWLNRAQPPHA